MIKVEVRVYATLRKYRAEGQPAEALTCHLAEGTSIHRLLEEHLKVPLQEVKTVFVNGVAREFNYILNDGDRVGVFPPIAGGQKLSPHEWDDE